MKLDREIYLPATFVENYKLLCKEKREIFVNKNKLLMSLRKKSRNLHQSKMFVRENNIQIRNRINVCKIKCINK